MKYLLLSIKKPVRNIEHALDILRAAVQEAVHLDRTLVVGTFTISANCNFGHTLKDTSFNHYLDLSKTQICRIRYHDITQITEPFSYIDSENFDLGAYPKTEVISVKNGELVSKELNHQYKVIVREITTDKYSDCYPNILVRFSASTEVDRLSNTVLSAMGTNLEAVKQRAKMYYGVDYASNSDLYQSNTPVNPTYYACLCLKYDNATVTSEKLYATDIRQIRAIFKRAQMTEASTVYVISDIEDAGYFEPLKKQCILYRYCDVPELEALISSKDKKKIDGAMLHLVEKNILQYASTKMTFFENLSGFPIIYSNSSHTIPWRYRFLAWYKSLIGHTIRHKV